MDYLRDPAEITRRSFAIVRAETELAGLPAALGEVALRLVHASAMPELVADLAWAGDPVAAGRGALDHFPTLHRSGKGDEIDLRRANHLFGIGMA